MLPNSLRIHDKNPMNNKTVPLFFLALLLVMTACTSSTDSSLQPTGTHSPAASSDSIKTIFFPRQKKTNGEWAAMDALTRGTLVLVDNCIRLERDPSLANYLLIWPPDFNFTNNNGTIQIVNGAGKTVASLGDDVEMSGGEIHSLSMLDKYIQEQVPPQCPGPYWITGYEFTTIDTASP